MTPAEIAGQRWFRAKQRPVASVTEVDRAPLTAGALVVVEVAYADDGLPDHYLLTDPDDGAGAWMAIAAAMADGAEIGGRSGRFRAARTGALAMDGALDERPLGVEQSNTSVVLGERYILKLYRLLEPGENPDLEVSAFLTDTGFADTPALAGSMTYLPEGGEPAPAAMLQAYVPARGDAWAAMLEALAADPEAGVEVAARVGAVTGDLHVALASRPEHPAFPARAATVEDTAAWRTAAERQLAQAVSALGGEPHDRLVALAPAIQARFADTFGAATGEARVTRIHGDYHLGQLLARTDGGFSVIDFEGEPARPLAERRQPSSPLRDVAGMLRSLDYAARTAERDAGLDAAAWLPRARQAFLDGYGGVTPSDLPLLSAFELEKACYEVRYEASNRPDWLWLPLEAVERLAVAGESV